MAQSQVITHLIASKKVLISFILLGVGVSWLDYFDTTVTTYLSQVMGEALLAFGSSKVIMAAVSLLKSIEVSLGLGVGASLQPFAFLEPLAEVADDFGDLMRVSIVSLITQIFLLKIVSSIYFKVLVTLFGLALSVSLYAPRKANFLARLFVFTLFLRFAVVLAVGLSLALNNLILQQQLDTRLQQVNDFAEQIDVLGETSSLSLEEREALRLVIAGRGAEVNKIIVQLAELEVVTDAEQLVLESLNAQLLAKQQELGRLKAVFTDDPEYKQLQEQQAIQAYKIKLLSNQQQSLVLQAANLDKHNKQDLNELEGLNQGWWQSIKTSTQRVTALVLQVKEKVQRVYDDFGNLAVDMMYVMAAFLLRTLIMPLVFLYAVLRVFRLIWQKDLITVAQQAQQSVAQELGLKL